MVSKLPKRSSFETLFAPEFMEMISDAFFVFDYSLHFKYVNKKGAQLVGKAKKELLGKSVSEIFPEVKKMSLYRDYLKTKRTAKKPLEYYSPSMKKWLSVTIHATKIGITVCAKDITDRKKAEDAARENQDILKAFFEHSPVSLAIYDEDMRFLRIDNRTAKLFFDKRPQDILGKSLETLSPRYAEKIAPIFQEIFEKNKPAVTEFSIEYKPDNMFYGLSSRFPLLFKNGKKGVGTITLDITDRIENEKRKDEFIAMASHELKTPLTTAKLFIQVLQRKSLLMEDKSFLHLLQKVGNRIDQLEILIKILLDAALTNRRKLSQRKEKFIFRELAIETIAELQLSIKQKLIVDWQTNEYLYADKERISQILINFVTNAAKFSSGGKNIIIRSRQKNGSVIISVQDFGIGISKEDQISVFNRFYQASQHKTYPGLGLGLYIAKKIIDESGGQVWVESERGKGSTFYFSLPIYKKLKINET